MTPAIAAVVVAAAVRDDDFTTDAGAVSCCR